ncbi:MAG: alanine racemase, partial [Gammaproteobacteria bacterium]
MQDAPVGAPSDEERRAAALYHADMSRPISATISIAALRHNLSRVRSSAPGSRIWAVVKANGYGHGLEAALAGFAQADGLALVEFDAAEALRRCGWQGPLLMLEGAFDAGDVALAGAARLALMVHESRQLDWLASAAPRSPIHVYLKYNSGMNRLGFDAVGLAAAHARLREMPAVASITLATHFANADVPSGAEEALARFDAASAGLAGEHSLANSAAVLGLPA